jgi:hypothetical protein
MGKVVKPSKVRIGLETAIALFAGALGILTIFSHDWIEGLTGWDPDQHSGAFEGLIVVVLLGSAAVLGAAARRDWRVYAAPPRFEFGSSGVNSAKRPSLL